jgi:integrase
MPRKAKELTAIQVRRLVQPGQHPVGTVAGLRLNVKSTGARSWVLRTMVAGRRTDLGLGGYPDVTLAQAFERARKMLDKIRDGIDPVADKRARQAAVVWTFEKVAGAYIEAHRASWKNEKHAAQWESTLRTYAYPHFGDKHVADVGKADVLAAIEPIWTTKTETATRVRGRIETVLAFAMQREHRPPGVNPASLSGLALPKARKVSKVEHHRALPIDDMPAFMKRLRAAQGTGARALEFAILTAARSGEVRGALWSEVDLQAAAWSIPAERMKADRAHRVPLSPRAVQLLKALPRIAGSDLVFPGTKDKPLSDMTLTAVLRRLRVDATVHGFRSTFRDWTSERTATPNEVAEMALAHAIGDATEAAYRRGELFEKRRDLMTAWAAFVG